MDYQKYLRNDNFPHIWCSGCGAGVALKAILRESALLVSNDTRVLGQFERVVPFTELNRAVLVPDADADAEGEG